MDRGLGRLCIPRFRSFSSYRHGKATVTMMQYLGQTFNGTAGSKGGAACQWALVLPPMRREIRQDVGGMLTVCRRSRGAASCRSGDSVAESVTKCVVCHNRASNLFQELLPRSWGSRSYKVGNCNKADLAGDVPSPARKWNNRKMDAKVQRIIRTAGPVIGSSKAAGTSKCLCHLRLRGCFTIWCMAAPEGTVERGST